jgi:hypothetical protein
MTKRLILIVAAAGLLAGCAGLRTEPLDYVPVTEIPKGPGLFSGDNGQFVILSR